ncbi:MAG TPA: RpiB/LacA/LacB family sugar-phosphate isomerase [Candidatus Dojkabacteria bacterium]|nr:RpiB/LacA/LacB family sugar-phosphate isomerase [Candidatus Dojkabacteria bacterium]
MIYIASDHRGLETKKSIMDFLKENGMQYQDAGPYEFNQNDDYPLFAFELAELVVKNNAKGILICSTGSGMAIAANKVKGARAVFVESLEAARLSREHNDCNILVLDNMTYDPQKDHEIIKIWYNTPFSGEERHIRRLKEISDYENTSRNSSN